MKKFQPILSVVILLILAACGGGGAGSIGGGAQSALNYVPVFATSPTDTSLASISGDGVTGVMSQVDTSLSGSSSRLRSVKVRLSADGNTAYLTVDGSTQSMPVITKVVGGGQFGSLPTNVLQVTATSAPSTLMTYSGSGGSSGFGAFGYVGIETPTAELPTAPVVYSGFWGGQVYDADDILNGGVVLGDLSISVDFDDNIVNGTFDGDVNANDLGSFVGVVSGDVIDNGIAGAMTITSGDFSGVMPFAGNAYGYAAEEFSGAFAGSITATGTSNEYATSGTFNLD